MNYHQDAEGTGVMYCAMSQAISAMRCAESLDSGAWRKDVDKDIKRKRGGR